ncbi:Ankyrin repeat [Diplonema papillatum]|nr:Ankyrin repeat [Diplonema papillatum]KAJ9445619.1 Ankyrin repeat [Diplonema papillatum]
MVGIGQTPLHFAAQHGRMDVLHFLIEHGAVTSAVDDNGLTPLHRAAWTGEAGVVAVLLRCVPHAAPLDKHSWTPLHFAADSGYVDIVHQLLEEGAPVDLIEDLGRTALHRAAAGGHSDVASVLLKEAAEKGVSIINVVDTYQRSPLHLAVARERDDTIRLLCEAGADVNKRDTAGLTAVKLAASCGRRDLVLLLLDYGAIVDQVTLTCTLPRFMTSEETARVAERSSASAAARDGVPNAAPAPTHGPVARAQSPSSSAEPRREWANP